MLSGVICFQMLLLHYFVSENIPYLFIGEKWLLNFCHLFSDHGVSTPLKQGMGSTACWCLAMFILSLAPEGRAPIGLLGHVLWSLSSFSALRGCILMSLSQIR